MNASPIVDVSALIEEQRPGRFGATLLFSICAFMFVEGYDMQVVGYAAPAIIKAWHSSKAEFGAAFGWGLAGFMGGALVLGSVGDRFGRKRMIVAGCFVFGVFTLACAFAGNLFAFSALRLFAGIGLGGAIPNAIALMTEYSPAPVRATRVGIMFIGYTAGSALGGGIAAWLIPAYGWPSMFILGGIAPIAIALAAMAALPESPRLLILTDQGRIALAAILAKLEPGLRIAPGARFTVREETEQGSPVVDLFTGGRAFMTALLWIAFAANLMALHFLTSWLPTVITESGVPLAHAVIATGLLQGGGAIGSLLVGWLLDRVGAMALVAAFALAAPCVAALGWVHASEALLMVLVALAGIGMIGGQAGINALSGTLYPPHIIRPARDGRSASAASARSSGR
jgi:AAHS family 4-hydroxybenzoate transporter-like MFS transporter